MDHPASQITRHITPCLAPYLVTRCLLDTHFLTSAMKFFNILALVAFASAAPTIKDVEERSLCLEDRSTGIEEFHSGVEQRSPGIEEIHSDIEERQSGGAADSITAALAELTRVVNISVEAISTSFRRV